MSDWYHYYGGVMTVGKAAAAMGGKVRFPELEKAGPLSEGRAQQGPHDYSDDSELVWSGVVVTNDTPPAEAALDYAPSRYPELIMGLRGSFDHYPSTGISF